MNETAKNLTAIAQSLIACYFVARMVQWIKKGFRATRLTLWAGLITSCAFTLQSSVAPAHRVIHVAAQATSAHSSTPHLEATGCAVCEAVQVSTPAKILAPELGPRLILLESLLVTYSESPTRSFLRPWSARAPPV